MSASSSGIDLLADRRTVDRIAVWVLLEIGGQIGLDLEILVFAFLADALVPLMSIFHLQPLQIELERFVRYCQGHADPLVT